MYEDIEFFTFTYTPYKNNDMQCGAYNVWAV